MWSHVAPIPFVSLGRRLAGLPRDLLHAPISFVSEVAAWDQAATLQDNRGRFWMENNHSGVIPQYLRGGILHYHLGLQRLYSQGACPIDLSQESPLLHSCPPVVTRTLTMRFDGTPGNRVAPAWSQNRVTLSSFVVKHPPDKSSDRCSERSTAAMTGTCLR